MPTETLSVQTIAIRSSTTHQRKPLRRHSLILDTGDVPTRAPHTSASRGPPTHAACPPSASAPYPIIGMHRFMPPQSNRPSHMANFPCAPWERRARSGAAKGAKGWNLGWNAVSLSALWIWQEGLPCRAYCMAVLWGSGAAVGGGERMRIMTSREEFREEPSTVIPPCE